MAAKEGGGVMLIVKNLRKVFNKEEALDLQKVALDDLSITIEDGEFVTIIGGNGSGKSTFINLIGGVIEEDEGYIYLDNILLSKLKQYQRAKYLGHVFQDPLLGTAGNMSVVENLYLASKKGGKRRLKWAFKKDTAQKFHDLVATLGLNIEDRLNQKIGLLSGGQRQAITLLMAILNEPKLLLLDEHTAALDPKTAKTVLELTNKIVLKHKITTLMVTHNLADALNYGNRLIMFKDGKVILDVKDEEKSCLTVKDILLKFEIY